MSKRPGRGSNDVITGAKIFVSAFLHPLGFLHLRE